MLERVGCAFHKQQILKSRVMHDVWHDGSSPSLGIVTTVADIHIIVMFACIGEGICHCVWFGHTFLAMGCCALCGLGTDCVTGMCCAC